MDPLLIISILLSFLVTFLLCSWWIKRAQKSSITGIDMHKLDKREIAEIGGLPVLFGYLFGLLLFVGHRTFFQKTTEFNLEILAVIGTITIISIIGIIDDILGWRIGLRKYQRPLLCLFAALPIMMIKAGHSTVYLPLIGNTNLGIIYPLIIVPIAISCAANGFNMIAGYNGLEAGLGIIILTTLGFIAWLIQGTGKVAILCFMMVACLIAFLYYNKNPARLFPGNTLTYMVGSLIAIIAILGNMEKAALYLFIPYFFEFVLKIKGSFKKQSYAMLRHDGSLDMPYKNIYGLEHLVIAVLKKLSIRPSENLVVYSLYVIQLIFAALTLMIVV